MVLLGVQTALSAEPVAKLHWFRPAFGAGIGLAGLFVVDLDGDGRVEIVAGGGGGANRYWHVLEYQPSSDGRDRYVETWSGFPAALPFWSLEVTQADSDRQLEILVPRGSTLRIIDGRSRVEERSITLPTDDVRALAAADVDLDGAVELVVSDQQDTFFVDLRTGVVERTLSGQAAGSIAVAQMDRDLSPEVALAGIGFQAGLIVDGASGRVEWLKEDGFGYKLTAADVDGDGISELAAVRSSPSSLNGVYVYDVDTRSLKYRIQSHNGVRALQLGDLQGDGTLELLYSSGWRAYVADAATGAPLGELPFSVQATSFQVADLDGDKQQEILLASGTLIVVDGSSLEIDWIQPSYDGPFLGADLGDVDGDGQEELAFSSYSSHGEYDPGLYFVHDLLSKRLEFVSEPPPSGGRGSWRLRTENVDGDPQEEIFFIENPGYSNGLAVYDGLSHEEEWRATVAHSRYCGMEIADVDGDLLPEVVTSIYTYNPAAPDSIYVYDAGSGQLEWQSPDLPLFSGYLCFLRVAELDGDANPELVAGESGGRFLVLSPDAGSVDLASPNYDITALETMDWDGDGLHEVIVGDRYGLVRVVDSISGQVLTELGDVGRVAGGLAVVHTGLDDGNSRPDLLVGADYSLLRWSYAKERFEEIFEFPSGELGRFDSLTVLRHAGRLPALIAVSGGNYGFGRLGLAILEYSPVRDDAALARVRAD
jgi:hypothetical protein